MGRGRDGGQMEEPGNWDRAHRDVQLLKPHPYPHIDPQPGLGHLTCFLPKRPRALTWWSQSIQGRRLSMYERNEERQPPRPVLDEAWALRPLPTP